MSDKKESDLAEYIKQDEAKPISADNPYNDTDALVLSNMAYIRFEDMKNIPSNIDTIGQYAEVYKNETGYTDGDENARALIEGLATNPRYKDLKLSNIESHYSATEPEQFAAMTVEFPNDGDETEKLAVFRGTDMHVTSWWEDGTFVFNEDKKGAKTQEMAVEYINNMENADKIYITGHSKGGHDAEWSGLFCNDEIKSKIVSIISLDGPGFRKDIKEENKDKYDALKEQLGDNWYTISPVESLVGFLMVDPENVKIVGSKASALGQHTSNTWIFKDGQLDSGEINTREPALLSQFMNDTIDDSLSMIPKPMLKATIDTGAEAVNGTLNDEILQYFAGFREIYGRIDDQEGYANILKNIVIANNEASAKLDQGVANVAGTVGSMIYSLDAIGEAIKYNLEKTTFVYGLKLVAEIDKAVKNEVDYYGNVLKNTGEKIEHTAVGFYDSIKNGISQYFDSSKAYRKMGEVYVEGSAAAWVEDSSVEYMEQELIARLGKIQLDCKAV